MDTPKPKPRRKRRCAREGCKRGVCDGYRCCSYLCNVVTDRIEQAERMCRAVGPCPTNTDLWVAVTELGDVLTRLQHLETQHRQRDARNRCHAVAPSVRAALWMSSGMARMPARKNSVT